MEVGISCMKRLHSVVERTAPCMTPSVKRFVVDNLPLYCVLPCRHDRKSVSYFL